MFYILTKENEPKPGEIATSAIITCASCGEVLSGLGGPQFALCRGCVNGLKSGRLIITRRV